MTKRILLGNGDFWETDYRQNNKVEANSQAVRKFGSWIRKKPLVKVYQLKPGKGSNASDKELKDSVQTDLLE